jgi:vancomycin resistance protein VanJ
MEHLRASRTESAAAPQRPPQAKMWARLVAVFCALYLLLVVAVWLMLRFTADRWWVGTVLMYAPRWVWLLPLAVLMPGVLAVRRAKLFWVLLIAALVAIGPVMRLCIPWQGVLTPSGEAAARVRLRLVTCNVDRKMLDAPALASFIRETSPDVVVLQGCAPAHAGLLFSADEGWRVHQEDQYCLAVRGEVTADGGEPIDDSDTGMGWAGTVAMTFRLRTGANEIRLANVHFATPRMPLEALAHFMPETPQLMRVNIESRRRQFRLLDDWAQRADSPVVVAGDFNTTIDSALYREHLSRFTNAFGVAGFGWGDTHFTGLTRARIDHIVGGRGVQFRRCWVGPAVGSAHRPVVADLEWPAVNAGTKPTRQ